MNDLSVRPLTEEEIDQVSGGLDPTTAGLAIMSMSVYSPATALFGIPIGAALLYADGNCN